MNQRKIRFNIFTCNSKHETAVSLPAKNTDTEYYLLFTSNFLNYNIILTLSHIYVTT